MQFSTSAEVAILAHLVLGLDRLVEELGAILKKPQPMRLADLVFSLRPLKGRPLSSATFDESCLNRRLGHLRLCVSRIPLGAD